MLSLEHDTTMKSAMFKKIARADSLNFVLTNHIPRALATRIMGRLSKVRSPLLTRFMIGVWRLFTDLDLSEARKTRFDSLHECFTRELKPGARVFDPADSVLCSPCDAIVGACGRVERGMVLQAKGMPYSIRDLLGPGREGEEWLDGYFVTLRLTSAMYHRFHAPADGVVEHVTYLSGDTWNVNPPALARIDRLFCRNERAAIRYRLDSGGTLMLVAVAAILVASIRLRFVDMTLSMDYRGPAEIPCSTRLARGEEMGWFEHGSTIIVFAPAGMALAEGVAEGTGIRAGEALFTLRSMISSRPS
jgi:phosphatidylserine decarboxylase